MAEPPSTTLAMAESHIAPPASRPQRSLAWARLCRTATVVIADRDADSLTLVGRLAAPEDLAAAVVFLCSDQSAFMTGRSLFMDGGLLA